MAKYIPPIKWEELPLGKLAYGIVKELGWPYNIVMQGAYEHHEKNFELLNRADLTFNWYRFIGNTLTTIEDDFIVFYMLYVSSEAAVAAKEIIPILCNLGLEVSSVRVYNFEKEINAFTISSQTPE